MDGKTCLLIRAVSRRFRRQDPRPPSPPCRGRSRLPLVVQTSEPAYQEGAGWEPCTTKLCFLLGQANAIAPAPLPAVAMSLRAACRGRAKGSPAPGVFPETYFLTTFLSCFGFLTSFFRTLFPLPITGSLSLCLPQAQAHGSAKPLADSSHYIGRSYGSLMEMKVRTAPTRGRKSVPVLRS